VSVLTIAAKLKSLIGIVETKSGTSSPEAWFVDLMTGSPTSSGINVTPRIAMSCAPWHCGVQLIAESIGTLPVHVYAVAKDGSKTLDTEHPAYPLLHDAANEWTAASTFREEITRDALLFPHGGFATITRSSDGKPLELVRIDQELTPVTVEYENHEPIYNVGTKPFDRRNLFHIPSPSLNGIGLGNGLLHEAREAIGLALTLERHAGRLFGNGARPSGVLSLKGNPTADALAKARAAWQAAHGGNKSGGTAVVPGDAAWEAITLNSVDAQFLELRQYAINEIARFLRVPVHMLFQMDRATWSNSEQMNREFLLYTLMSWIRRWESEIALKLFNDDERARFQAKFETDQFTRPDFLAFIEALGKAVAARIYNPNEARAMLDKPGYAGGEKYENPNTTTTELRV
jgi:HK97 family phage portal protein